MGPPRFSENRDDGPTRHRPGVPSLSDRRLDEAAFLRLVRGESRGIAPALARLGLAAASWPYRAAVSARNLAFDRGWKASHQAGVPVIAVGNLTLGGTGKTPMVEWVCAPSSSAVTSGSAILSRGYGQAESGLNDEGRVLEDNLPDVPHLQGTRSGRTGRGSPSRSWRSQVLVLDDGFQHRRLARDLDLVLLDALDPFGLGRLFPRGLLREPVSSLRRAGVVVLSRADLVDAVGSHVSPSARRPSGGPGPLRWAEARHAPLDLTGRSGHAHPELDRYAPGPRRRGVLRDRQSGGVFGGRWRSSGSDGPVELPDLPRSPSL